jgi:glycosyltransferase involved in cell wall biosynthesis
MPDSARDAPRILVFAYACEPGRGSEPGAGWGVVRSLAQVAHCTVLVGPEHVPGIDLWAASFPSGNLTFVHVGEPWWGRHAKHHRLTWFPLYLLWLRRARHEGQRRHRERPFDLAYHATYSAFWLPSPVTSFGVPSIWGPVGGAVATPRSLWGLLGPRGFLGEVLDALATRTLALLPITRRTWHRATVRIVQNEATLAALPRVLQPGTRVLNHATMVEVPPLHRRSPKRQILSVGPLEARKGVALAIHALLYTPEDVRLQIVGDGPRRSSLQSLARRIGVAHRVDFVGRVSREQVFRLWEEAAGAVFTGLREEGGLALAEAMLCGVPVVVLAHGGAKTLAAAALDPNRVAMISPSLPAVTAREIGAAMTRFCDALHTELAPNLDARRCVRDLHRAVDDALGQTREGCQPLP